MRKEKEMTAKQHYIPRFFLERFADKDGVLWVYDAENSKKYEKRADNICYIKNLYETEWDDTGKKEEKYVLQNDIENTFSKYESEFSKTLKEIDKIIRDDLNSGALICSNRNKEILCRFIANLIFRNPKTMKEYKLSEIEDEILNTDETKSLCYVLDQIGFGSGLPIIKAAKKKAYLTEEIDGGVITDCVKEMRALPFMFFYAQEGSFIIKDMPVCAGTDKSILGNNKLCFYVPLSSKIAVLYGNYNEIKRNRMVKINRERVNDLNNVYIGSKEKQVKRVLCSSKEQRDNIAEMLKSEV